MGRFTGILGRTSGHKRTDGFLVWPSDLVLAPLRELVSHVRRTLLTLTHNAGVKLGAVPSTDSDFENGGSTSKSANGSTNARGVQRLGLVEFAALWCSYFRLPSRGQKALPMGTCDPTFGPIGFRILVRPAQTDCFCKL